MIILTSRSNSLNMYLTNTITLTKILYLVEVRKPKRARNTKRCQAQTYAAVFDRKVRFGGLLRPSALKALREDAA
ncbi:unnamed protein product [Parnassius apollo]|uniref:(apollo) hypothetical protein n=1 Tax=Parnassius apollo TaxID=110799 RepID=A0A8S3XHP3_PARAO|nr:unnamed protein product [Parnassius apollo]